MTRYSVKQLAALAHVSIRTLHHYDKIGLLKPSVRSEKGYRYYGSEELLRLQQIFFYKELGFPLSEIRELLDDENFDLLNALEFHKEELRRKAQQYQLLLQTIDKTINKLKNNSQMEDKEMYEGFTTEEVKSMREEVKERWGAKELNDSEERIRKLSKEEWQELKEKGELINRKLAGLMSKPAASAEVQQAIAEHYEYLNAFSEVSRERYLCLGRMYVEDARFTATYERYGAGLAQFLKEGIEIWCREK